MITPLLDFYRCAERHLELEIGGELSREPEYFWFGGDLMCYGRFSRGGSISATVNGRPQWSAHSRQSGKTVVLPFDLREVIDNLQRERYTKSERAAKGALLSSEFVRNSYYLLRPLLGIPVRRHLQKFFLRDWEEIVFPRWPVDTTVEALLDSVMRLCIKAQGAEPIPFIWFWPEGASSCATVTHDVEAQAGMDFIEPLMEVDEAYGIRSSFQLIPAGSYPVSPDLLRAMRSRGFEIGVQDLRHNGNLFDNWNSFQKSAVLINGYAAEYGARGFRAGRLYRNLDWYDQLNVSYDMSVPNVGHMEAQRGGCCTVFPYFVGGILELPLTTSQDYSLFHILGDYSIDLWKKQIELVRAKHGLASFIVHPDYVREGSALNVYKSLLGHLNNLRESTGMWIALPQEINHWWRERSRMTLVKDGGAWRIEGPGKDRARIAYARLEAGRIVYDVEESGSGSAVNRENLAGTQRRRHTATAQRIRTA